MKTKHLFIFTVFFSFTIASRAQQAPLFGFTSQLLNVSNPSMSRTVSPLNVTMAGRKYWTGIQGSPEAFIGSFSISPQLYKSSFGGFFWAEKAPFISKQVMGMNYAYGIKNMDEGDNLRLGMGIDFISVSSNNASILTEDYSDPFYTALSANNKTSVDFRIGGAWNNDVLEIGLAIQQLIKSKNNLGETTEGKLIFNNTTIANGHFKYTIKQDEDVKITPLIFWQTQKAIPMRVDLNVLAEKTGKLWGGIWLRPKSALGIMAGLWVLPDVKLGYMYEKSFFKNLSKAGNSHELLISYAPTFSPKEKMKEKELDETYKEKEVYKEKPEPEIIRVRDTIVIIKETRVIETPKVTVPTYTPKDDPIEPVTPKPTTPSYSSGSKFYVVTGLFGLEANAKNYEKKLQAEGYKTSLVKNPSANQYYVSIGNFNSMEEAHQYISKNPNPKFTFWVKEIAQ